MKTYKAIEGNMEEQTKKINSTLDLSDKHTQIQESETFKDFQKTLDQLADYDTPKNTATDMLMILDKYSNVLIDVISSKVKSRETLIE